MSIRLVLMLFLENFQSFVDGFCLCMSVGMRHGDTPYNFSRKKPLTGKGFFNNRMLATVIDYKKLCY
jgi:hypothetical protein